MLCSQVQRSQILKRRLGHVISEQKRKLNPEKISGIINMPLPKMKWDHRKSIGLVGSCRLWIDAFASKIKDLHTKLLGEEPDSLIWKPKEVELLNTLKQDLMTAPVLFLPSLEKSSHLFVSVDQGTNLGVLT
jgi:hypothetical protein